MATCGTITVTTGFDPSNVSASCDARGRVDVGETTTIEVSIDNENDRRAAYTGTVRSNGRNIGTFSGTVRGGGRTTESVGVSFNTTGEKSISIDLNAEEA